MTALGSGVPDRETISDEAPRRGLGRDIAAVLVIGLVFRLILAYGIPGLRGSGFETDLNLFRYWADTLAQHGPWGFYANASYADYTPGYLYALWLVGIVGQAVGGVGDLIKLPAILTDVAMAYLVWSMAMELGVTRRRAVIAAAIVVFNPVTWFDSVIWGQVDSFGTVFLLLSVRELWRGRSERSAVWAVAAAITKPQLAILIPIVALVVIRRSIWRDGAWGDEAAPRIRGLRWERTRTGPVRILTTAVTGFVTAVLLALPFGLTVLVPSATFPFVDSSLLRLVLSTAGVYPYLTVNAYNIWALFPVDGQSMATGGGWLFDSMAKDATVWGQIGPFSAAVVGSVALLTVALLVAIAVARKPDRLTILVGTCVIAFAFFAVPTRVHERYLFPLFGMAGILIAFSWRWRIAYLAASIATFLNMYVVLTTLYGDMNPNVADWLGIGETIRSSLGVTVVALLHTGAFLWALVQLRPKARRTLAAELEAGGVEESVLQAEEAAEHAPVPHALPEGVVLAADGLDAPGAGAGRAAHAHVVHPASHPPASGSAAPALVPAWYERPSWSELGPIAWLRARVGETPIRPDRSASLATEGHGRVDRLDVFLVVVFVVASLFLRTYRLAEPARMHFDEVYHARTATEFLQDWRYGISHNIYEWTHPHLAKYVMAGGIVAFAGHDVAASSNLGIPVADAAIEPRREDPAGGATRAGDRVWVATGDALVAYDLETRALQWRFELPGARAVAFDEATLQLVVGTDDGSVLTLDTTQLDGASGDPASPPVDPVPLVTLEGSAHHIVPFSDGQHVAVLTDGDTVDVVDLGSSEVTGSTVVEGATAMAAVDKLDGLVATLADVTDPKAVASELATTLGSSAQDLERLLATQGVESVVLPADLTSDNRTALKTAIDAGKLPGIQLTPVPTMAVAGSAGLTLVSPEAAVTGTVDLAGPAKGLALVSGIDEGTDLYVTTTTPEGKPQVSIVAVSGDQATDGPVETSTFPLPGAGGTVIYDKTAEMVQVEGQAPGGAAGTVVYMVEPHGNAVFADHKLPFTPVALTLDHNEKYPSSTRGALLAFSADGVAASLDISHYVFAWRLPGVIFGALTVAMIYLLTRVLFRRREVALLAGLFVLVDGMFFVQSRIAMNDVYTGFFIIAAYLGFAWLWVTPTRPRWSFWVLMPVIGVLLGLALASKWVAAYAIGALGILFLLRSALGRLLLIAGMVVVTALLGWMALAVPEGSNGAGNLPFVLIMIGLTLATVAISVYRPVAWTDEEARFTISVPPAIGIVLALTAIAVGKADTALKIGPMAITPLEAGFALVLVGIIAYAAFTLAARFGIGPMAPARERPGGPPPASPAPEGWLRMGTALGFPVVWVAASLLVIPLAVYVALYLPWAFVDNHQLVAGWPAGHTGQTLVDLTGEMYRYHNNLTAAHAASSPWWAWPMNLKPVWFYQGSFADGTAAAIYDAGNLVLWWLSIPAMCFVAYQAFKRRSIALALILVAFLAQWISWARIDRAAFQYHYYTSLPFVMMALAYFVAEVWHGASRRAWLLARVSAAVALMGPVILWVMRYPLCAIANVESVNKGSQACNGNPGNLVVTPATAALVAITIVTSIVLLKLLFDLGRARVGDRPLSLRDLAPLLLTAAVGLVALMISRVLPDDAPLLSVNGIVPEVIALIAAIPLGLVALQIATARDARRFVAGLVAAAVIWFAILYPNIAALPLPSVVVNAYQGLLPTYLYAFQFGVNTVDRSGAISFADPRFAVLFVVLVVASVVVAYSAWAWRQALAAPEAEGETGSGGGGPDAGAPDGDGSGGEGSGSDAPAEPAGL